MPKYDRAIPPGGEGKIRVAVDAKTCMGGAEKSTVVTTNDRAVPRFTLHVKAEFDL
ncbi:MAG: hypothetical protein AB9873_11940 [Syntrophobacteraceae bacterium]